MSMLPKIKEKLLKLEELDTGVPKDPDITLVMCSEDGKEIGFVHNITKWDPSTLLNNKERGALEKFLQLSVLRLTSLSNYV